MAPFLVAWKWGGLRVSIDRDKAYVVCATLHSSKAAPAARVIQYVGHFVFDVHPILFNLCMHAS